MSFKYKHTQILQILTLISECKKEGLIIDDERRIMKEFIVTKEPDLTIDLAEYEKDHALRKLLESLKVMSDLTQMSSPVDNNLIDRKRKKQHEHAKPMKKKVKEEVKEEKEDVDFQLDGCDIGNSPSFHFSKKIPRDSNEDDD